MTFGLRDDPTLCFRGAAFGPTEVVRCPPACIDAVGTTIYVAPGHQRDLVAAWKVVRDTLAPHDPPSTLLGVAVVGDDDQVVEVDAIAALSG